MKIEVESIKCFESFSGLCISSFQSLSHASISISLNEKVQVYQIRNNEIYIKTSDQEGWVPKDCISIQRQKLSIDYVTELDLKLLIRAGDNEKVVKPTYTNLSTAAIGISFDLESETTINLALTSVNEVIGSAAIDLSVLFKENQGEDQISYELQMYTRSWKINYVIFIIEISKTCEPQEFFRRRSFVNQRNNLLEKSIFSTKVTALFNDISISGHLHLTSHYFFISSESSFNENWLKIWIQCIRSIKLFPKSVTILTKDLRQIEISCDKVKDFNDHLTSILQQTIDKAIEFYQLMSKDSLNSMPSLSSNRSLTTPSPSSLSPMSPSVLFQCFQRYSSSHFSQSYINIDYKICDSYPCLLYFPVQIGDLMLKKVAEFRSKGRLPTVTWCKDAVGLYRSSQPKLGLGNRSADDENFFKIARIKYVIDARPGMNAKANRLKGKGYEREADYEIKLKFMNIQNIHHVTRSFEALVGLGRKRDLYWTSLGESKWLSHVMLILEAAVCCANHLVIEKVSLLVHCSDGWDRTSQICALTQLLIDPVCRTINGFQLLIAKDWLAFGHKFFDRTFGNDYSPIFLLFLDCVQQVLQQFPEEFEFNGEYLIYLADASIRGVFGEFLANCEKDRLDLVLRTQSVWGRFAEDWRNSKFRQGFFDILPVDTLPFRLRVWEFFTRFV